MADANSIKVTISIPMRDNEGRPFTDEDHAWLMDRLVSLFVEGFTKIPNVQGWWRGHDDANMLFFAAIQAKDELEAARALAPVREFLGEAKVRFRQKAMYLEWHWVHGELI